MADLVSEDTINKTFSDIPGLSPWIIRQLKYLKVEQPSPVQYHCIPKILEGKDVVGAAKTGSGKTLAFIVPIIQQLSIEPYGIYCLILTPTRELAFQIGDQLQAVGAPMLLKVSIVTGGMDCLVQGRELALSPHIVVATPGRLTALLESSPDFSLKRIKFLVLDEADTLWNGYFDKDLSVIWKALPEKRQTLLFSATMTDTIKKIKDSAKKDIFVWASTNKCATVQQLNEQYCIVNPIVKEATLVGHLLKFKEDEPKGLAIVFTDTCYNAQLLSMLLMELDIECLCLHSMLKQKERLATLTKFKSSQVKILVSTDLASRGLDIPKCTLIVNHVIPKNPKTYIHRVGRTARFGKAGASITLITPQDLRCLMAIELKTKRKMTELKVDEEVVRKIMKRVNVTLRERRIRLDATDFDEKRNINIRKSLILEGKDPEEEEKKKRKLKKMKEKETAELKVSRKKKYLKNESYEKERKSPKGTTAQLTGKFSKAIKRKKVPKNKTIK